MNFEEKYGFAPSSESETHGWECTIPEGFEAEIRDGKVIVRKKESEDERIRKAIISLVHENGYTYKSFAGVELCDMLSYLEKQKEQKPVDLQVKGDGVYKICPHCKERMIRDDSKVYTSMPPQYGYNCPKCGAIEFDTVMYDSPAKEEQKPAEWSEEEERILNALITHISIYEGDFTTVGVTRLEMVDWLKSLRPQPHWKPSKKQMEALEHFIRSWGESGTMSPQNSILCAAKSLYNDLKSL